MKTPLDFGAKGDGVADDAIPLQQWLDYSGSVSLPPGTYLSSRTLLAHSHTTVYGSGGAVSIIKAHPLLIEDESSTQNQLLTNAVVVGDLETRTDGAIQFHGVGFQRHPTKRTAASMLGFGGVDGILFRDCVMAHSRRFLTAFTACSRVTFDGCELYDWGSFDPVAQPGACLHDGGYAIWAGVESNSGFRIINTAMRDGEWTAIHWAGEDWLISNSSIRNVREAGIFGGATRSKVTGCTIIGVRLKDCSSHGIETGSRDNLFSGNTIGETEGTGIMLSNPINSRVDGNLIFNPGTNCIGIRNHGDLGAGLDNVSICGNTMWSDNGKSTHAMEFQNQGAGEFNNFCATGNNIGSKEQWSGEPILIGLNVRGKNFEVRDNTGDRP